MTVAYGSADCKRSISRTRELCKPLQMVVLRIKMSVIGFINIAVNCSQSKSTFFWITSVFQFIMKSARTLSNDRSSEVTIGPKQFYFQTILLYYVPLPFRSLAFFRRPRSCPRCLCTRGRGTRCWSEAFGGRSGRGSRKSGGRARLRVRGPSVSQKQIIIHSFSLLWKLTIKEV